MKVLLLILFFISSFFFSRFTYSQGEIIDDFSLKAMPGWIWGGVEMVYSHQEDNKENGFAEIHSKESISGSGYVGKIMLKKNYLFTAGNFINIMLKGFENDAYVKIQLLYDVDNDSFFDDDKDLKLSSKPVSINFNGWKEIKLKLDQDNFEIISKFNDSFEVTEEEAFAIQLEFEAGSNYKKSKFESGIALVSEVINKEAFESGFTPGRSEESYFKAKNYPNPFNPVTTISFELLNPTYVSITVYDRLGREIVVLLDQNLDSGEHSVDFNATEYPSGIYFYRIKTPERTEVRKMLLTK